MRGTTEPQSAVLMVNPEAMIPTDHPIRVIKKIVDEVLDRLGPQLEAIYAERGRPSIPPEMLLKAQILIALYTVRSERLFCERLRYDFLFRWFLDLRDGSSTFDATTFSKNRERLLEAEIFTEFFREVVEQARGRRLLSDEHFTVDGTLIEANASLKSFRKKDGGKPPEGGGSNVEVNFRGEKRKNDTHESTTDPAAKLYRKGNGQPAQLCYLGHVLMENRNGLCTDATLSQASGRAEPEAALDMVLRATKPLRRRVTLGADKGYDRGEFIISLVENGVVPHIAQIEGIHPLIDRRTTGRTGYQTSQRKRKRVEEIFGWAKTVGGIAKTRFRGAARVAAQFVMTMSAYNLVRMARLEPQVT
ncbi:MAG: IS5 family transposase [Gemmatimonadaceae bacterium]